MSRFKPFKAAFGATAAAMLASASLVAAPALASSPMTVTFAASPGSSAGFVQNGHAIKLHVAGKASTAFAVAKVHNFPTSLPNHAPSFDASFAQSGTPRWYIKFKNGDFLFGYPYLSRWDAHTSTGVDIYVSYKDAVAFIKAQSGGTLPKVKKVQIIADGSATPPYTTLLTNVRYAGQSLTK